MRTARSHRRPPAALAVLAILATGQPHALGQRVYWAQSFGERIRRAYLNGSNAETIIEPPVAFEPIAIRLDLVNGKLYWAETFENTIRRANLDGTGVQTVLEPPALLDPVAIALDLESVPNKIYWAQSFDDGILRANLDGTGVETLVQPPESFDVVAIAVDAPGGALYWAENPGDRIRKATLDGSNVETFLDVVFVSDPSALAVDRCGNVYWAERSGNRIRRATPDGLTIQTLADAVFVNDPVAVAVVGPSGVCGSADATVYWAEDAGNRIRRKNSGGVSTVIEAPGVFDALSLDIEPGPPGTLPPTPTTDCTLGAGGKCRTRSLTFTMLPPGVATGTEGVSAIRVVAIDLYHPSPTNPPGRPQPNFSAFDTDLNSACTGPGPLAGYHCHTTADCPGSGTCPTGVGCTAPGETGGCARWVGPPLRYLESRDSPGIGSYLASRLQCTPYYQNWDDVEITVLGSEIVPSSTYTVTAFGSTCKGVESRCANVSPAVQMKTRRGGDVFSPFNPPSTSPQPEGPDVAAVVNKFKNLPGAIRKAIAQVQSNFPIPTNDVDGTDIAVVVDAVKGFAYGFSGPCICPSTVPCDTTVCSSNGQCAGAPGNYGTGAQCVRECQAGPRVGQPCTESVGNPPIPDLDCGACSAGSPNPGIPCDANSDCSPGTCATGVCGAGGPATTGFCRDRCARCTTP